MRCVAGVGLFALVGCNQVFGINPTRAFDASIDVPPDRPHVLLNWQIANVIPMGGSGTAGAPAPLPAFVAIDPAPTLRIGPLHAPDPAAGAAGPVLGELTRVDYLPVLEQEAGAIVIPREFLTQPWRLEYTLADNVPHEVQWQPEDKQGHLTVPAFGPVLRDPPPTMSGYTITPGNAPTSYTAPRVFTTGLWTEGPVSPPITAPTIDYDFANALPLSGTIGRPDGTRGDRALVVDFRLDGTNSCRTAAGAAPIDPVTLQAGTHMTVMPTWDASTKAIQVDAVPVAIVNRANARLGDLGTLDMSASQLLFGSAASTGMPGLTGDRTSPALGRLPLPAPVMTPLLQCPAFTLRPLPDVTQPAVLDDFPRVLHVQLVARRQALGVTLISGLETVLEASAATTSVGVTIAFPAPFPTQIQLAAPGGGAIALDGPGEQIAIGPASGTYVLTFTPETDAELRADYHDVVLHRIIPGDLTTERIYTVTQPSVSIDGALLVPGADYVLEIRTYKGHPRAVHGDFAPVDYPYGAAIVFTRTFKTG